VFDPTSPGYDYPEYGVLDASAGATFKDVRVSLFAKNVLNENQNIQPGRNPFLLPSDAVFYPGTILRPRTIGISASAKF
jgi:outer membrane receptor protein involved in Fe transport